MNWHVYEALIQQATEDRTLVEAAHQVWNQQVPQVHAEHTAYLAQSDAFLEWYACEWATTQGAGMLSALLPKSTFSPEQTTHARALLASHSSLFRIVRVLPNTLLVEDLWGEALFEVEERRQLLAFAPGDLFEGRLIPDPEHPYRLCLGKTFLSHPSLAYETIRSLLPSFRVQSRRHWLWHLQRLRLRSIDYPHLSIARIYATPP